MCLQRWHLQRRNRHITRRMVQRFGPCFLVFFIQDLNGDFRFAVRHQPEQHIVGGWRFYRE